MKNLLLTFLLGLVCWLPVFSQSDALPRFRLGLAVGVNYSGYAPRNGSLAAPEFIKKFTKPMVSPRVEGIFRWDFNGHFGLRSGIVLESKGAKLLQTYGYIDPNSGQYYRISGPNIVYRYLSIPLSLEYSFGNRIRYYGGIGLYGSYKYKGGFFRGGKQLTGASLIVLDPSSTYQWTWFDWGLNGQAGVSLKLGKSTLFYETKFSRGLFRLNIVGDEAPLRHWALTAQIGISTPLSFGQHPKQVKRFTP